MVHTPPSKAVFLDRDDTLIACNGLPAPPPPGKAGDLVDPRQVELLPGVFEACERLVASGFRLVVVSNQGSVARGAASLRQVEEVNNRVRALLTPNGGTPMVQAFYFCPFHPVANVSRFSAGSHDHAWRKPNPGMILAAAAELNIDLTQSWMVGDAPRDIESGLGAGLPRERCLRVGCGGDVPDLLAATERIIPPMNVGGTWVTLRALSGEPLRDAGVRGMVESSARALAERSGMTVLALDTSPREIRLWLPLDRFAALGFAAELRRVTNAWYEGKYRDGPLWGTAREIEEA